MGIRVSKKVFFDNSFVLLCLGLFLFQVWDVWMKYASSATTIVVGFRPVDFDQMKLRLTLCPFSPYKGSSIHFTPEDYMAKTYSKDDLFYDKCFDNFTLIHEVNTTYYGRCFTLSMKELTMKNWDNICQVKNHTALKVVAHFENEEFWLQLFDFPLTGGLLRLNLGEGNIYFSTLKLTSKEKRFGSDCLDYDQTKGFIDCFGANFSRRLQKDLKCKIPGTELTLTNASSYPYCQKEEDVRSSLEMFESLVDTYAGNIKSFGCLPPCRFSFFETTLSEYHRSSWVGTTPAPVDHFKLAISLSHFFTEVHTETLIYDQSYCIGQIGGHLGLLLGFSCLSIYFFAADCFQKAIKVIRERKWPDL